MSLPLRGAWIEIEDSHHETIHSRSLPLRGAWIEICLVCGLMASILCRSPCGERGLKLK